MKELWEGDRKKTLLVFGWHSGWHMVAWFRESWWFCYFFCRLCQLLVKTEYDFQFGFEWCSTLYVDMGRDTQFELEWYTVWCLSVAGTDCDFQSA